LLPHLRKVRVDAVSYRRPDRLAVRTCGLVRVRPARELADHLLRRLARELDGPHVLVVARLAVDADLVFHALAALAGDPRVRDQCPLPGAADDHAEALHHRTPAAPPAAPGASSPRTRSASSSPSVSPLDLLAFPPNT